MKGRFTRAKIVMVFALLLVVGAARAQEGIKFEYRFSSDAPLTYLIDSNASGYLPIFGGQEGTLKTKIGYTAALEKAKEGDSVKTSLASSKVELNGQKISVPVNKLKSYLPPKSLFFNPNGHVNSVTAEKAQPLPLQLPGMEVGVLDEWAVFPIQFPDKEIKPGDNWSFTRPLSRRMGEKDAPLMTFNVKFKGIEEKDGKQVASFTLDYLSEPKMTPVVDSKDKNALTLWKISGTGNVYFLKEEGRLSSSNFQLNFEESGQSNEEGQKKSPKKLTAGLQIDCNPGQKTPAASLKTF